MKKKAITVVISGFAGTTVAEPGGAIANSLRKIYKNDIKIVALVYSPFANTIYESGLIDEVYLVSPLGDPNDHFNDLARVFYKCDADIYIPALELEVRYVRQFYKNFKKHGPKMLVPDIEQYDQISKLGLHYFCNTLGFLYPSTIVAENIHQLRYNIHGFALPCLIKSTLCGAQMVYTYEQAEKAAYKLSDAWTRPVLIQSYIEGEQFMVAALYDENENIVQTVPAKKHLLSAEGKSAITISIKDPELENVADKILKSIPWSGPLELEFIRSSNGSLFLFEINPRFPSWIDIGSRLSNNLPSLLVHHLLGGKLSQEERDMFPYGDVLLRDTSESYVPMDTFKSLSKNGMLDKLNIGEQSKSHNITSNYTIAITGASSSGITTPSLSIAKYLRHNHPNVNLVYLTENYHDTGCYRDDLFDAVYNIDFDDNESLYDDIELICGKRKLDAIIPTLDRHILPFSNLKDRLSEININCVTPSKDSIKAAYNFPMITKNNIERYAPKTILLKDGILDINKVVDELGPKVVLKMLGSSKSCVRISSTIYDVYEMARIVKQDKEHTYAIQQFIYGEHFAVCGFADNGKLLESVSIKSIQSCDYGKVWMATEVPEYATETFSSLLSKIVSNLSWNGPIEIDCIREYLSEKIHCIDINPRLPAWASYLKSTNTRLMEYYVQALLKDNSIASAESSEDLNYNFMYVKHPKNYYSKTDIIGKLLSAQEINYRANN